MSKLTGQEQLNNVIQAYNEADATLLNSKAEYTRDLETAYSALKVAFTTHVGVLSSVNKKQSLDIDGLRNTITTLQTALTDAKKSSLEPESDIVEVPPRADNVA